MRAFMDDDYGVLDINASMNHSIFWSDAYYGFRSSSLTELYKYTGKIVLKDSPKIVRVESNISENTLLARLRETNVVNEPEVSLENMIDVIYGNGELKKVSYVKATNSGIKINDYMLNGISF